MAGGERSLKRTAGHPPLKALGRGFGWWLFILLVLLSVAACRTETDETDGALPSTGYVVLAQFLPYYEQYGSLLLGEPISGACETADGTLVQYFQRARLELAPGAEQPAFAPLGDWALEGAINATEAPLPPASGRERRFADTGYAVRDEFLAFYESLNGETVLGPPISEQLDEGDLRVQYFRYGRLEWHPDAPPGERVQMTMLGQAHYVHASHDVTCERLARPLSASAASEVTVRATLSAPILYPGFDQVVYVTVETPGGVPVSGVSVFVMVETDSEHYEVTLGRTDGAGQVHGGLLLPAVEPGSHLRLTVRAAGMNGSDLGKTSVGFRTWW